jgi:hypothetical protein
MQQADHRSRYDAARKVPPRRWSVRGRGYHLIRGDRMRDPNARVALLCVLASAALLAAPTANAGVFLHDTAGAPLGKYNRWARLARVEMPNASVTVLERSDDAPCSDPTAQACERTDDLGLPVIEIALREPQATRLAFWHELGHVFDRTMLNDAQRQRFQRILGPQLGAWHTDSYATSPDEQFARSYALCARVGPTVGGWYIYADAELQITTTGRRHRQACRFIWAATQQPGGTDLTVPFPVVTHQR